MTRMAPLGDSLEPPPPTSLDVPFAEDFELQWLLSHIPASYAVKGMFLSRIALDLGDKWASASKDLLAPPKWGRYLPFSDYPMVDQARLAFIAAQIKCPSADPGDALRRCAREDMRIFKDSTLGRITVAVVQGPAEALLAVPGAWRATVKGARFEARAEGPRRVVLTLFGLAGAWGYQVGQIEGILMNYGVKPTITCALVRPKVRTFDVAW